MNVYFISGMGANKKAFKFLDLSFCAPIFIDWITPIKNETLAAYAVRLRATIKEKSPVIVGISFGGMLATEMAKADPNIQVIIISSNKCAKEFPNYLRIWKHFPVYKWIPERLMKSGGSITRSIVGPKGQEQRTVFSEILLETDHQFNIWAIDAILGWKNNSVPTNVFHIHGSADALLPCRYVKANHIINGGSHFMIMDNANELSELLKQLISPK